MSENQKIVYHYCSIDTFKNIIKSKVLWLCNLRDSNDEEEIIRIYSVIWEKVKNKLKNRDFPEDLLEKVIYIIDNQYKIQIESSSVYGICFCKKEDLVNQWCEYGDHTKGLSLGFNMQWFSQNNNIKHQKPCSNVVQSNCIGYDDVIYDTDFVEFLVGFCYKNIKKYGESAVYSYILPTFIHYSGFIKNPSFEGEKELRIIYYPNFEKFIEKKDVKISNLKSNVKSHYEIQWINNYSQALESICIGNNCELSVDEIKKILIDNHIDTNILIKKSECKYRIK